MIICFILIVAECNVNGGQQFLAGQEMLILIVAECNVNRKKGVKMAKKEKILIVAECNVNIHNDMWIIVYRIFNSSRV